MVEVKRTEMVSLLIINGHRHVVWRFVGTVDGMQISS